MRDLDIRKELHSTILKEYHDDQNSLVFDEFGLGNGATRVDIAVVNGALHGFEIKSDRDTLARLPKQIELYSKVLDYAILVVGKSHAKEIKKFLPKWWGIFIAIEKKSTITLHEEREAKENPSLDLFAISQLLWHQEALMILEAHGLASGLKSKPRRVLWEILAKSFEGKELAWLVRETIKHRTDWRSATPSTKGRPLPGITVLQTFSANTFIFDS